MTNDAITQKVYTFFSDAPVVAFKKGDIITPANQEPKGVSLLREGVVEQYDITPDGSRVTVNIFKPGAFFPMSWAINRTPNPYVFSALTDVTLQRAHADAAVDFLKDNPDVTFDLLSRVYRGTDGLLQRLVIAARGIASSRLIFELLLEAYRFGQEVGPGNIRIKLKQHTLAARSGLARETVSRELGKLTEEGLITTDKSGTVIDTAQLEQRLTTSL